MRSLTEIQRRPANVLLAGLRDESETTSREAGTRLVKQAAEFGLGLRDYLLLAMDTHGGEAEDVARYTREGYNGYEVALDFLGLPFKDDFVQGVTLAQSSETFQRYPGTRAMFPEVIDDMLRWQHRQEQSENLSALIAQSRTISGTEMVSSLVPDDSAELGSFLISELGNIPVRTIRTSETAVKIHKHGSGYRTSYEFGRRASLDILSPYARRVGRQLEISKVAAATRLLVNGDGVNPAASVVNISDFGGDLSGGKSLSENYKALAKWLVSRAKAGVPIDTIVGNYDTLIELMFMFVPNLPSDKNLARAAAAEALPDIRLTQLPLLNQTVNFALSTTAAEGQLLGYSKDDTIEELVEAGSLISESEQSIKNQSITYVRTENSGCRLVFGDTREVLDFTK